MPRDERPRKRNTVRSDGEELDSGPDVDTTQDVETTQDQDRSSDANPPRTTTGPLTSPKFGSAGSGGAELEPGPERP